MAMGMADRVPALAARVGARLLRALPGARGERRSTLHRATRFLDAAAVPRTERYGGLMQVFSLAERAALWTDDAQGGDRRTRLDRAPARAAARPTGSPASSCSISTRTCPATCCRSRISHRWRIRWSCGRHCSTIASSSSGCRCRLAEAAGTRRQGRASPRVRRRSSAGRCRTRKGGLRHPPRALVPRRPASGRARPADRRAARDRGWFEQQAVERLLDDHAAERADNGHRLWTLTMLELWQRTTVDAARLQRHRPSPRDAGTGVRRRCSRMRGAAARSPLARARLDHLGLHREERHLRADVRHITGRSASCRASRRRTRSRSTAGSSYRCTGSSDAAGCRSGSPRSCSRSSPLCSSTRSADASLAPEPALPPRRSRH